MAGNLSGQRTGQSVANAERFREIARKIRWSDTTKTAEAILRAFVDEVIREHDLERVNLAIGLPPIPQADGDDRVQEFRSDGSSGRGIADANLER